MDIVIVGCGVSGLTSGVRLLEAGHRVTNWAFEQSPNTTSDAAAAIWEPYEVYPADLAAKWGRRGYDEFLRLAETEPAAGIVLREVHVTYPTEVEVPDWAEYVPSFRRATKGEIPPGSTSGFIFISPVIDMSLYMGYLSDRYAALGGTIVQLESPITSFDEAFAFWQSEDAHGDAGIRIVVNCAGWRAGELANDPLVIPARGQVVRIASTGFDKVLVRDVSGRPTYIVPRVRDIVLGGTFNEGDTNPNAVASIETDILERCAELALYEDEHLAMSIARLAGEEFARAFAARVKPEHREAAPAVRVGPKVGFRPTRKAGVRLPRTVAEVNEPAPGHFIIHNYGHGGGGVTLSWGCADQVVDLVQGLAAASTAG